MNPSAHQVYSPPLEAALETLQAEIAARPDLAALYTPRWVALKLLEGDSALFAALRQEAANAALLEKAERLSAEVAAQTGQEAAVLIADERYGWIGQLAQEVVRRPSDGLTASEKIDRLVTHRWLGLPLFLLVMLVLFRLTSELPAPYVNWLDNVLSGPLPRWIGALLGWLGLGGSWIESLLVGGLLPGVGGVLAFVPVLGVLYLGLGLLEDSGYMARAAFVVDRLMQALGLQGKSFLPMIVGFGCSVPGIYATRTMENQRQRILTGMLVPFMSCGARLPVYMLLTTVFFPRQAGLVIFGLYLGGIVMAVLAGLLLNRTLFRSMPPASLILELPPYHRPVWKNIIRQAWERTAGFVRKAGTTILACSMVLWLLMAIPVRGEGRFSATSVEDSLFAALSGWSAPLFAPLGFGNWQSSGALITGVVAKEVVVSSLAQAFQASQAAAPSAVPSPAPVGQDLAEIGIGFLRATGEALRSLPRLLGLDLASDLPDPGVDHSLASAMQRGFAQSSGGHAGAAALAFVVFVLLYTPCISALVAERQELGVRWMLLSAFGQLGLAWLAGLLVFQVVAHFGG